MTFANSARSFSVTFDKVDPVDHQRKLYQVHVAGAGARTFKVSIPASSSVVPQPSPTSKIEQWFRTHPLPEDGAVVRNIPDFSQF
jgi:hypothetical protein